MGLKSKLVSYRNVKVYVNNMDVTNSVAEFSMRVSPGDLATAQVEYFVREIEVDEEGNYLVYLGEPKMDTDTNTDTEG